MLHMTHEHRFPDSEEAPEARTARAIEALNYEEKAGLGFRRRVRTAIGNPYGDGEAERYQIDREMTSAELWSGYLAGIGVVLGGFAIFYKPLLLGLLSIIFSILGSLGDGQGARIAKIGLVVGIAGFTIGMLMSIFVTHKAVW
jgi:hypothetical protein